MQRRYFISKTSIALGSSILVGLSKSVAHDFLTNEYPFIYKGKDLILSDLSVKDVLRSIEIVELPDPIPNNKKRLKNVSTLTERLWRIALSNAEANIVKTDTGSYFGAGKTFGAQLFSRDISFSGVLGLNKMYPDLMLQSLKYDRATRRSLGMKATKPYFIEAIKGKWDIVDMPDKQFLETFKAASYTRRTDDIVWIWSAHDLLTRMNAQKTEWEWLYDNGVWSFENLFNPFFDEKDGLFRGQATFVDIHYPQKKATGYPLDFSVADCVLLKPLSTNCLYVFGYEAMANAAKILGKPNEEVISWKQKANDLRKAICKNLKNTDGTFAYFKDKNGVLENRRDAMGTALAILSDVVTGKDAILAIKDYPVTEIGIPLFYPFYDNPETYHNHTAWPFVDCFFLHALEKATGVNQKPFNAALLARTCVMDGSFHEIVDFNTKEPRGSGNQLWTAAAFINVCERANLTIQ